MKKILLFALTAVAITNEGYSQIDKGTILTGGNLHFSTNKSESTYPNNNYENKTKTIGITPSVGFAIKPNTFIGIQLGYSQTDNNTQPNSGEQDFKGYSVDLFLRRYPTLGKGFYLFGQPGIYFSRGKSEYTTNSSNQETKSWNVGASLYPGISYAVSKRFHLEAGLGNFLNLSYVKSESESKDLSSGQISASKASGFSFSSSLSNNSSINIGFRFFIPKKGKSL